MHFVSTVSIIFTLAWIIVYHGGANGSYIRPPLKRDGKFRLCGRALSDTLALVCESNYNKMYKKSAPHDNNNNLQETSPKILSDADLEEMEVWAMEMIANAQNALFPFKPRNLALSMPPPGSFRRRTRGIVDECCHKSCSYEELYSYCGPCKLFQPTFIDEELYTFGTTPLSTFLNEESVVEVITLPIEASAQEINIQRRDSGSTLWEENVGSRLEPDVCEAPRLGPEDDTDK